MAYHLAENGIHCGLSGGAITISHEQWFIIEIRVEGSTAHFVAWSNGVRHMMEFDLCCPDSLDKLVTICNSYLCPDYSSPAAISTEPSSNSSGNTESTP